MLSFSGNAVVRDGFLLRRFFYLSLTHAPIYRRLMRMLWMQRNIGCIAAATFLFCRNFISVLPPCCLLSKQTANKLEGKSGRTYLLIGSLSRILGNIRSQSMIEIKLWILFSTRDGRLVTLIKTNKPLIKTNYSRQKVLSYLFLECSCVVYTKTISHFAFGE